MAHFAKVQAGLVVDVIVAEPEFFEDYHDPIYGEWVQVSYNTRNGVHYDPETGEPSADQTKALRKNYPGPGYIYHADADAFSPSQPYPSWTLNTSTYQWEPPLACPAVEGTLYRWDEVAYQADTNEPKTAGWVEVTQDA